MDEKFDQLDNLEQTQTSFPAWYFGQLIDQNTKADFSNNLSCDLTDAINLSIMPVQSGLGVGGGWYYS